MISRWNARWGAALCALAACTTATAEPAAGGLYECPVAPEDQPELDRCVTPDVVVVFDRSASVFEHGNWRAAVAHLRDIAARVRPAQRLDIVGVPAPGAHSSCEVTGAVSAAQALGWPRPGRSEWTPLVDGIEGALAHAVGLPPNAAFALVVITDGYDDCGRLRPYSAATLQAKARSMAKAKGLEARLAHVVPILVGEQAKPAEEVERELDAALAPSCRISRLPETAANPIAGPSLAWDWFPDVVAVGTDDGWHCSGVVVEPRLRAPLIRGRAVLTARHCLPATRVGVAGAVAETARVISVTGAVPHPDPAVDVALLILEAATDVPTHVGRRQGDRTAPSASIRVVGFGADDPRGEQGAGDLHMVELPVSGWGCDPRNAERLDCRPEEELVVRGNGGHDACRGDSGAPAFERLTCGWRLVGITSRAIASARRRCGDGGIYTRIDAIDRWLEEQLRTVSEEGE